MIDSVLIANRGEIACRIIRSARQLGLRTVAVYSEADADAPHVARADTACLLGPAPANESYLAADKIIAAARASRVQAIHPGYGFLAESAAFAQQCADAGLLFIGPAPAVIAAMGDKGAAKSRMAQAGVPVVPGYDAVDQSDAALRAAATELGFPLLLKPTAGGGGKGIRIVASADELADAIAAARREAGVAFGDDRLQLERYLPQRRHIEVQVFGDEHNNAVHLFERDCSVQRRYQKVIEEAPAPNLDPALRRRLGEAAVAAARAIQYRGAGTVEFLLDDQGAFYFVEMNTRLQVEHPVTELITGEDLVAWQFRVASGEPLPRAQEQLAVNGHAIEVRLYAEDPARDLLPATGTLHHWRLPALEAVRIDTGVDEGAVIGPHYDPLLAKLIAWGHDRAQALAHLRQALTETEVMGVASNLPLLRRVAAHPAFTAGRYDTGFIDRYRGELTESQTEPPAEVPAHACLYLLLSRSESSQHAAAVSTDPYSPWHQVNGWRLNEDNFHVFRLQLGQRQYDVTVHFRGQGFELEWRGSGYQAQGKLSTSGSLTVTLDSRRSRSRVVRVGDRLHILWSGNVYCCDLQEPSAPEADGPLWDPVLAAPMPGQITLVNVRSGDRVRCGDALLVLSAMKMEHTLRAPQDGVIGKVHFAVGAQVEEGVELLRFCE